MKAIPSLSISQKNRMYKRYDSNGNYTFRYRSKYHQDLPHVVKFSGGRSSGMLLFTLLENGLLKRDRGDVVVFNNTSCEHPATYRFAAQCKKRVEAYGIPFFFIQFQTYEDARQGEWKRIPTYRLVNENPKSESNKDGFEWRGEAFEEMLSNKSFLPNQFSRVCTKSLKLEITRQFLTDWFANKEGVSHQGHGLAESQVDIEEMYTRHIRSGGGVPKDVYIAKKNYVLCRPTYRPKQCFRDFSNVACVFDNSLLKDKVFGKKAWFGDGGIEYVAFIGLRGDEQLRVARVESRSTNPHANRGYEGEHVYMPFTKMKIGREDVNQFWGQQGWDLQLAAGGALSNCVYCFLKGIQNLSQVHATMENQKKTEIQDFGSVEGTPCDVTWWREMESRYGRNLVLENREHANPDTAGFIGFFGATSGFSFDLLAESTRLGHDLSEFTDTVLPCDCTE